MCCLLCEPEKATLLGGSGSPAGDTGLGEQGAGWLPAPPAPQTEALLQVKLHNQRQGPACFPPSVYGPWASQPAWLTQHHSVLGLRTGLLTVVSC